MPRRRKPPGMEKWTWAEIETGRRLSKEEKRAARQAKWRAPPPILRPAPPEQPPAPPAPWMPPGVNLEDPLAAPLPAPSPGPTRPAPVVDRFKDARPSVSAAPRPKPTLRERFDGLGLLGPIGLGLAIGLVLVLPLAWTMWPTREPSPISPVASAGRPTKVAEDVAGPTRSAPAASAPQPTLGTATAQTPTPTSDPDPYPESRRPIDGLVASATLATADSDPDPPLGVEPAPEKTAPESEVSEKDFSEATAYKVLLVPDGQTLVALVDGQTLRIRLLGVMTEDATFPGKDRQRVRDATKDFLQDLLADQWVYLEWEPDAPKDRLGVRQGYVYLATDGTPVNRRVLAVLDAHPEALAR